MLDLLAHQKLRRFVMKYVLPRQQSSTFNEIGGAKTVVPSFVPSLVVGAKLCRVIGSSNSLTNVHHLNRPIRSDPTPGVYTRPKRTRSARVRQCVPDSHTADSNPTHPRPPVLCPNLSPLSSEIFLGNFGFPVTALPAAHPKRSYIGVSGGLISAPSGDLCLLPPISGCPAPLHC